MLDVTLIRNRPDQVRDALRKRAVDPDIPGFLTLDTAFREARTAVERLRGERRRISAEIAVRRREGAEADALQATAKALTGELADAEARLAELAGRHQEFLDALPNLPDDDVAAGGKENNEVVRAVGAPPAFGFPARDHVELTEDLGLVDHRRGAALAGSGYWIYRGEGAALEWALLNHFLDAHRRAGYEFVLPPHLLTYEAGYTAGQFPKFADEVFRVDGHFLLPTAETALVNLHRGETLDERDLPRRYVAYTPCYRRESGSHRTADRGTLRGHQFNKVELFQFARPGGSDAAHLELLARAEELVAGLGLHYRVTKLAAGDISPAQAKTYDVEVWLPSLGGYAEVSSVSNAREYQARRGGIRYRPAGGGRSAYVHTLNASGLATSRLLPAILEQHQRADGTVAVPEVLRRWGLPEVLRPRATSA
ncbi:seryl-tRNA synthetase [Streptomyces viridochromogenes]|uniref:Serine--tRNA ligase n=1 Tax=Streptomyces viridochromogenes TaxID=1938 RepID=A0A0J7ZBP0_STRVR|nr:serine--tRNA ligase [Streptomyces viridochromogenes]KMS72603.1 seryl-tRNA synthetase [Streptomyces viridochromogenes]KOG19619.1 seryl-tRNA synthetase [Streptomyces viridochromogenes]KOG23024.1 seryl-tRNA synthetase [Streptomyces viridochromogenes]